METTMKYKPAGNYSWVVSTIYILFLLLPIYWLINRIRHSGTTG
jgi:glycerol transport system permease protein